MESKFFITTAIDYVNSSPHLGTAYEKIAADVLARYKRNMGVDTFFLMGTDEHSVNVSKQAKEKNIKVEDYCDQMVGDFISVWDMLNISYNDFIRTTQERHIKAVKYLMQKIYEKGDLYESIYKGWYCNSCESFIKEKDLENGCCPFHRLKPEWIEEKNYFFRLSKYQEQILKHITENKDFIRPDGRKSEILNIVKNGLEDLSVTRSSIEWGITVPFDDNQTVYVWFDALINYISALGYPEKKGKYSKYWPCNLHVIGKDITRFHCIIWPAMLMSAGIELPESIFGHGFVYLKGQKMSKTLGTTVDPVSLANKFGSDAIRYYLMREVPFDRDGEFSMQHFISRYNADLANDLGNLLQRVMIMIKKYCEGKLVKENKTEDVDSKLAEQCRRMVDIYVESLDRYKISHAVNSIWDFIKELNRYIENTSPWMLYKKREKKRVASVLYNLADYLRIVAIAIKPIMPDTSQKIIRQLNVASIIQQGNLRKNMEIGLIETGTNISKPEPLFPKFDIEK